MVEPDSEALVLSAVTSVLHYIGGGVCGSRNIEAFVAMHGADFKLAIALRLETPPLVGAAIAFKGCCHCLFIGLACIGNIHAKYRPWRTQLKVLILEAEGGNLEKGDRGRTTIDLYQVPILVEAKTRVIAEIAKFPSRWRR